MRPEAISPCLASSDGRVGSPEVASGGVTCASSRDISYSAALNDGLDRAQSTTAHEHGDMSLGPLGLAQSPAREIES